jgi:hypothetical integral membrane protein (TIGR02206 family)
MSPLQVFFLMFTFVAPVIVWFTVRRQPDGVGVRRTERGLALLLVAFYLTDLVLKWRDGMFTPDIALPMQLCDWALFAISAALWWRWRMGFEVAYFWGLAGTFQALLTPAISPDAHWFRALGFFFIHAGIVAGIFHLLLTVRWRPTPRALLHLLVASELYIVTALTANALTGGNYGFLSQKPSRASMLDLFSSTHWLYVVEINLTAFVFYAVLYLPWFFADLSCAKPKAVNGDPAAPSNPRV